MGKIFTNEQAEFIKANIKGKTTKEIAAIVNNTFNTNFTQRQIQNFKSRHKCPSGLGGGIGRFKTGQTPWNKGKKWSPEFREKMIKTRTMFEKGHIPISELPIGTERVNRDGLVEIKVKEADYPENSFKKNNGNGWIMKHHKIWIDYYKKPVPKGHKIIFIDQNKRNFDINNLKLVSNALMARLNQNHRLTNDFITSNCGIMIEEIKMKTRI